MLRDGAPTPARSAGPTTGVPTSLPPARLGRTWVIQCNTATTARSSPPPTRTAEPDGPSASWTSPRGYSSRRLRPLGGSGKGPQCISGGITRGARAEGARSYWRDHSLKTPEALSSRTPWGTLGSSPPDDPGAEEGAGALVQAAGQARYTRRRRRLGLCGTVCRNRSWRRPSRRTFPYNRRCSGMRQARSRRKIVARTVQTRTGETELKTMTGVERRCCRSGPSHHRKGECCVHRNPGYPSHAPCFGDVSGRTHLDVESSATRVAAQ